MIFFDVSVRRRNNIYKAFYFIFYWVFVIIYFPVSFSLISTYVCKTSSFICEAKKALRKKTII